MKPAVKPGTIVWGTHREEDLWEAFRPYLPDEADWVLEGDELYQQIISDELDDDTVCALSMRLDDIINNEVYDYMNEIAPAGHYFGAHPGDGSDFGFWEIEEDFELPAYTDLGGYPIYYVKDYVHALCPDCANELEPSEKKDLIEGINWEDPHLYCDECGERIESAYAEEEAEAELATV